MFILVNNRPFNILNIYISDIKHLDREVLYPFITAFGSSSQLSSVQRDFIKRCEYRNIIETETIYNYENFKKKYPDDVDKNPNIIVNNNYGSYQVIKFDSTKYFFFIRDEHRAEISEPYDTIEDAEEARNRLLTLVNKVFYSLKRCEI